MSAGVDGGVFLAYREWDRGEGDLRRGNYGISEALTSQSNSATLSLRDGSDNYVDFVTIMLT